MVPSARLGHVAHSCARCLVDFPAREGGRRRIWCRIDRFYVCARCWRRECGGGHGERYEQAVGWGAAAPATLFAITALVVGPIVIVFVAGQTSPVAEVVAITASAAVALVWGLFFAAEVRRSRLHASAVQGRPTSEPVVDLGRQEEPIRWEPNVARPSIHNWTRLAGLLAFGLGGSGFFLLVGSPSDPVSYLPAALIFDIAVLIPLTVASYSTLVPFVTPSRIAIAKDGVHFWYDSPYVRYVMALFVPWEGVTAVRFDPDTEEWVFVRRSEERVPFGVLSRSNLNALLREWHRARSRNESSPEET